MDPQTTIFEEIATLVAYEAGVPRGDLRPDTRLLHDLQVYGDDADELLEAYAKRFGVDFTEFDFRRYFYDEPSLLSAPPVWSFRGGWAKAPKEPLTLAMLVAAAEAGRWSIHASPAA